MRSRAEEAFFKTFINLLNNKSFGQITVSEIIRDSGYSRSCFYKRYDDKYQLAKAMLQSFAASYAETITETMLNLRNSSDFLYQYSVAILSFAYENRALFRIIFSSVVPGATLDEFCKETILAFHTFGSFSLIQEGNILTEDFFYYVSTHQYLLYLQYWNSRNYSDKIENLASQIQYLQEHIKPLELFV